MGYGRKIKEMTKEKNMTLKELAKLSRVNLNTLYSITKRDNESIDNEIIIKIAPILGVSIYDFVEENDKNPEFFYNIIYTYKISILRLMGMTYKEFMENMKYPEKASEYNKTLGEDYLISYIIIAASEYDMLKNEYELMNNEVKDDVLVEINTYINMLNIKGKYKAAESIKLLTEKPEYRSVPEYLADLESTNMNN